MSTALYLSDGATQAILVANDAIFVSWESAGRVRATINAATGVPAAHIMLTATHTHSAPKTVEYLSNADDPCVPPVDPGYLRFFEAQMIAAACAAVEERGPAQAGLAVADGTGVGTHRRKVSGPADPQAPVLLVRTADGQRVIACMVVNSMHPTVLRENFPPVSADFPGAAVRGLQRTALPAGCPILYHTGPAGDQSPAPRCRAAAASPNVRGVGCLGRPSGRDPGRRLPGPSAAPGRAVFRGIAPTGDADCRTGGGGPDGRRGPTGKAARQRRVPPQCPGSAWPAPWAHGDRPSPNTLQLRSPSSACWC